LLQQKKDLARAKAAFAKSVQLDKSNTDALMKLGEVQAAAGQPDEAIATFQAGAKDNPQEAGFHLMLGQIYLSRQDWEGAEQEYQKVLAVHHDDPIAACNLAYVIMQKGGDLDIALSLAQTARRRMPASADAADTLGWVYYQKGAFRPAVDSLESAIALMQQSKTADNPRYRYHLGMAYAKSGNASRAREQLQRMLKMNPDFSDATDARKELARLKS
jgi:tetratricopeptide (TPR) repeat protein